MRRPPKRRTVCQRGDGELTVSGEGCCGRRGVGVESEKSDWWAGHVEQEPASKEWVVYSGCLLADGEGVD